MDCGPQHLIEDDRVELPRNRVWAELARRRRRRAAAAQAAAAGTLRSVCRGSWAAGADRAGKWLYPPQHQPGAGHQLAVARRPRHAPA